MTSRPLSLMSDSTTYSLILLCNCCSYRHKTGLSELLLAFWAQGKFDKQFSRPRRLAVRVAIKRPGKWVCLLDDIFNVGG